MADVVLSNGKEITFDLNAISRKEYRALFNPVQPPEEETATLAKVSGLTPNDIENMPYGEFRQLAAAFFRKAREPLADPNFQSASSSD